MSLVGAHNFCVAYTLGYFSLVSFNKTYALKPYTFNLKLGLNSCLFNDNDFLYLHFNTKFEILILLQIVDQGRMSREAPR